LLALRGDPGSFASSVNGSDEAAIGPSDSGNLAKDLEPALGKDRSFIDVADQRLVASRHPLPHATLERIINVMT
jgi:hypothetical protein